MLVWLIDALVALIGLAHAIACWVYFSRLASDRWLLLWSLGWVLASATCIIAAHSSPLIGYGLFTALVTLWTVWWSAIKASATLEWVPENRYQSTGTIVADSLRIKHVRNFDWKGKNDFDERWEERVYDLASLNALDLFVCTWGSPHIAHVMLSFDFGDDLPLCISIETRREAGEHWTALAGFMKSFELLIIAGDERDLVKSRVNIRGEDVRLYRVCSTAQMRRRILERLLTRMNLLAERPRFYNTVFHNCTIEIAYIVWEIGQRVPLDWRILVSGYVGEYLYDIELLDRSRSFPTLKSNADIRKRSLAADTDRDYSRRIREGLADPNP